MAKIIIWNIMSLDGCFEGATPWDLSMHETVWGPELEALSKEQLADNTILLFGKQTYEGMFEYWSKAAKQEPGDIAGGMNRAPKVVVSTTLKSAEWQNSRLVRTIDEVRTLKCDAGPRNIFVFGSAQLTSSLRQADLIDEYRICIAPLLLGKTGGAPLFKPQDERLRLDLIKSEPIAGGGVLLFYKPVA
ncbi:dihydrofolate reductase family protein [Terricaulis sp.]|uniref:dihydrofolate reductase family protein n=1 Tax=Terricaulis sp. TaxID=2768686 RepID=UPI0037846BBB